MPALLALPVVAVLWVAVGLPVLSQVTGAAAGNRLSRNVAFATQTGGAGGSSADGSSAPQTVAAATVSTQVLAAYHAEVARRARARAAATAKAKTNAKLELPQLTLTPTGTATLATVNTSTSPPTPSQQSSTPPAKDDGQDPGSSGGAGGSGDNGGATSPGTGTGGSTSPAGPGEGTGTGSGTGDTGSAGGSDSGGSGAGGLDTGDAGDIGGSAGSGGTGGTPPPPPSPPSPPPPAPPTPPAPPPPPPAPPSPPPPPAFPAPADIQTWSGGGPHGRPRAGDAMVFVFAGAPDPAAILPGWDGSATTVTFQINDSGTNDFVTVLSPGGAPLTALGSVSLGGDYANQQNVTASGSTMFLWGKMIVVILGSPTGKTINQTKAGTMVWTTPGGPATESGPLDSEF